MYFVKDTIIHLYYIYLIQILIRFQKLNQSVLLITFFPDKNISFHEQFD